MAILDVKVDTVGQSGQVPKFIYIETDDTLAEVQTAGYLNKLVREGFPIDTTSMALIITKETPSSKPVTNLYKISKVGPDYDLFAVTDSTIYGATNLGDGAGAYVTATAGILQFKSFKATGSISLTVSSDVLTFHSTATSFNPAYTYDGSAPANPSISGNWRHVGAFNVQAGTGNVLLQSDTGSITLKAPNAGQSAIIEASNLTASIGNQVSLTAAAQMFMISGGPLTLSATTPVTGQITFNSPKLAASTSLVSAVTSNVLYFDTGTGAITHGLAPGGGSDWNLTGTNSGAGLKLGTNDANGWQYVANSVAFCTISAAGTSNWSKAVTFTGPVTIAGGVNNVSISSSASFPLAIVNNVGGILLNGPAGSDFGFSNAFGHLTAHAPLISFTGTNITYSTGGGVTANYSGPNLNYTVSGDFNVNCIAVKLNTIALASKPNQLFIDATTKVVSYGPVTSFDTAANYTTTGEWLNNNDWTFSSGFVVNNGNNIAAITSASAVPINITNETGGVVLTGSIATVNATTGDATVIADAGDVAITSTAGQVNINAANAFGVTAPTAVVDCTGQVSLQSQDEVRLIPTQLFIDDLPNSTADNILFYNPSNFEVTQGVLPLPFQPVQNWTAITVPGTYEPVPNTTYFVDALNVIFLLPQSIPTNAQFEFVGQNRNFVINANLGQNIRSVSTLGGTITTLSLWNSFVVKCTDVNTNFQVTQLMGSIDIT